MPELVREVTPPDSWCQANKVCANYYAFEVAALNTSVFVCGKHLLWQSAITTQT